MDTTNSEVKYQWLYDAPKLQLLDYDTADLSNLVAFMPTNSNTLYRNMLHHRDSMTTHILTKGCTLLVHANFIQK